MLAPAANQQGTDPKSVNDILAMRQADKMGWDRMELVDRIERPERRTK